MQLTNTARAEQSPTTQRQSHSLPSPATLRDRLPVDAGLAKQIQSQRRTLRDIVRGKDSRLLVVVGPCSLHDPKSALEYGHRLAALAKEVEDEAVLVMRAYVEKPRTTVGWKGLLYDPHLDGSNDIETGLTVCRNLLRDLSYLGLPLATEILHPMAADYLGDLLSWAAIGARTTESQVHREMVSGLPFPVGLKNGTDGSIGSACDAMAAAQQGHSHLGLDAQGQASLVQTSGNPDTHLVLRGGRNGPNYSAQDIDQTAATLTDNGLNPRLMVDCSHANSGKDPQRQPTVLEDVLTQRRHGQKAIMGVMLESHLRDGKQALGKPLKYGISITDGCLGWDATEALIHGLD